jgi:hypothetical protein
MCLCVKSGRSCVCVIGGVGDHVFVCEEEWAIMCVCVLGGVGDHVCVCVRRSG